MMIETRHFLKSKTVAVCDNMKANVTVSRVTFCLRRRHSVCGLSVRLCVRDHIVKVCELDILQVTYHLRKFHLICHLGTVRDKDGLIKF